MVGVIVGFREGFAGAGFKVGPIGLFVGFGFGFIVGLIEGFGTGLLVL